jgi:hypothetical protein
MTMRRLKWRPATPYGYSGHVMRSGQRLVFEDIQNDAVYRDLSCAGNIRALGFSARRVPDSELRNKSLESSTSPTGRCVNIRPRSYSSSNPSFRR